MKRFKLSPQIPLAFGSILPLSAIEYKFKDIKFDQVETRQDIYDPKDKLDEYIIKAATYSTKFVPLMNIGAEDPKPENIDQWTMTIRIDPKPADWDD